MKRRILSGLCALAVLVAPAMSYGQGVQTGALTGTVKSNDGITVPDASIRVTSPALQGERMVTTDINGVYVIASLPPGHYTVKIAKDGLNGADKTATVPLGGTANLDATLTVAGVSESVVVEAVIPPSITENQTSANILSSEVNVMPMGRTPYLITELMPGVTTNTPSANQVTISGGFAYDNVFLIDGVDVNDNLIGSSNDLYIEDAIGEVQVLTAGISAEYGRFSGGVINIITKSGGNMFNGSYRTTFTNPSWSAETPFETVQRPNKLSTFSELTAGGPVVKDRLWFFGAGRFEQSSTAGTLQATALPYTKTNNSKRYEAKLTATTHPGHTLQGTYVDNRVHRANEPVLSFSIDKSTLISPSTPNHLGVVNYNAALSSRMLASVQVSQKHFETAGVGSTMTNIVDSPFLTRTGTQYQYNAPLFDANDPEERNNRQLTASLTYFMSDRRLGSHEFKGGFEDFVDTRIGANSQTSTGYLFTTNFKVDAAGLPMYDANGHLIPVFTPGTSRLAWWLPERGAKFNMSTVSAYMQDRWVASSHMTFNLGMRYEHASSDATGGINTVDVNRIVPRLGASYDLKGDGKTVLHATYSRYSGKYNDVQFSKNTLVGNSNRYGFTYSGPAGEGRDFAAGFNPDNYAGGAYLATFPNINVKFDPKLSSPVTDEFTLGAGRVFGARSFVKAVYVDRKASNFVEDFTQFSNGTVPITVNGVTLTTADVVSYENSDQPKREYRALEFMGQHRISSNLAVNGQWTVQLKNDGNFEGESPNPVGSPIGDFPELLSLARSAPEGHLDDFQRSKVRLWANYSMALGAFGSLDVSPLYRFNSAKTYSLAATGAALSSIQSARNPGYATSPITQTLFFGDRGSESFKSYSMVDLALTYGVPVWKSARPWVKFEMFNVMNNQKLIAWNTAIAADPASAKDENGIATGYVKGPSFGTATSVSHYPGPRAGADGGRTFDLAVGFRF
jgi:hypothetical protein